MLATIVILCIAILGFICNLSALCFSLPIGNRTENKAVMRLLIYSMVPFLAAAGIAVCAVRTRVREKREAERAAREKPQSK